MQKQGLIVVATALCAAMLTACGGSGEAGGHADAHASQTAHADEGAHEIAAEALPIKQVDFVDNFVLLDQDGKAHDLYYNQDAAAIVVMIQGNGCPIVRNAWSDFKAVRDEFEGCLLYTSPSPRDLSTSRMPSSA